ncbi:hypothetical protein DNL40_09335 [Xylanimonas oleitrophica]|uniref:Small multi-drug export protein n=1 Tax=Xylanimonas oleitrophica TaxID=2607479 RepID=A0A2W5YFA1_9MICO|nr:small multi-drug export protein [Xylanimonas oleitrophica]PZR53181.1 hypothetical protein DNL40_09335 [Xylanimonas oleitrophica]
MSTDVWWGLAATFLGGAIPWLEAVVVIPAGIVAGLPTVPVIMAGTTGNLLTVGLAAFAGERIKERWSAWRARRASRSADAEAEERRAHRAARRQARIDRVMARGGLPLLALVGPLGLGTQLSALAAVAAGVGAARTFVWIGAATVLWCVVAAVAAVNGLELLGLGG